MITTMAELEQAYDEYLDELHPEVLIGCSTFYASNVLKELDPIAYRCGLLDFANAIDVDTDELQDDI